MMRVRIGYEFGLRLPQDTPLILMVTPEETRHRDFVAPEEVVTDPTVAIRKFRDRYGNICQRLVAPAGDFTLGAHAIVRDHGEWDEVDADAREMPIEDLPDEVMTFLAASRYVESDVMAPEAWRLFGHIEPGWRRVQAVLDHGHQVLRFDYGTASPSRTALDASKGGTGVCRDFAHLALAYLRGLNIPARYVNGYVGDIGVPAVDAPMDFAAWIEVWLSDRWWTFDPRNNERRLGRVVIARGHDAADVPMLSSFGPHELTRFQVWCHPVDEDGNELPGMDFAPQPPRA